MRRAIPWLFPMIALAACGSETTTTAGGGTAGGEHPVDEIAGRMPPPAPSTAPVPTPTDLVGTMRAGSIAASSQAALAMFGVAGESDADLRSQIARATGSQVLASVVDTSGGFDSAFIAVGGSPELVIAFDGPSMREVVSAIPTSTLTQPLADGALMIPAAQGVEGAKDCAVEPTSSPARTRIVCADDVVELESARLYLARNLTDPVEPGHMQFALAVQALRDRYASDAHAGLAVAAAMISNMLEQIAADESSTVPESIKRLLRNEEVRSRVAAVVRDLLDDVGSLIDDLESVTAEVRFGENGVHVDGAIAIAHPSGSLVRALIASLQPGASVPTDLLARLPPGAFAYFAGRSDGRPFEELVTDLRDLLASLAHAATQLSQPDRDALDRALALLARPRVYTVGAATGFDTNAHPWTVSHLRFESGADGHAMIDAFRQGLSTLRRPSIARAFDDLLAPLGENRPRIADIQEIRLRGVPAGTFAVRMPPLELVYAELAATAVGGELPATLSREPRQVMFVPSGNDVLIVQATDAAATYRGLASAGGLPSAITTPLLEPGWAWSIAIRAGNIRLANQPIDDDAGAPTLESVIGTEAGQAVSVFRVRDAGASGAGRIEITGDIPAVLLRGLAQARSSAAPSN